jgi:hypothetical protein
LKSQTALLSHSSHLLVGEPASTSPEDALGAATGHGKPHPVADFKL